MQRRQVLIAASGLALAIGAIVIERAIVTDGERIDVFVDAVTGTIRRERVDAALVWFRPDVQAISVQVRGETDHYGADNADGFALMCHARLRPFDGTKLILLSKQVDINADRARVAIEVLSQLGRRSAEFELRKHRDQWLVSSAIVR